MLKKALYIVLGILVLPIWTVLFFMLGQHGAGLIEKYANKDGLQSAIATLPKLYIVESGSMEPGIKVGSVVVVRKSESYLTGDVVSFDTSGNGKNIVTHRISYKKYPDGIDGNPQYFTKGDANEDLDSKPISQNQIVGKVDVSIPYLGYLANYAKKPWGFILLVIVPATILIYEELRSVVFEIAKKIKKRKKESLENERGIKKSFTFLPVFGAVLVMASVTASFLNDTESSLLNLFQAASEFDNIQDQEPEPEPPQLQNIVINEVYYNVADGHLLDGESTSEWVELYNPDGVDFGITGWSVFDNTACDNLPGTLMVPANGYAIIASVTKEEFETVWGVLSVNTIYINLESSIGNGLALSDETALQDGVCDSGANIIDHISWGTNVDGLNPSIPGVSGEGISLERAVVGVDTNANTDFMEAEPPTPGS